MSTRFRLLFFSLLISTIVWGQQKPQYTQYFQNMALINPAVTGIYSPITIKTGVRNQWSGLENAPKTSHLSIGTILMERRKRQAYFSANETEWRSEKEEYLASPSHHGVGLLIVNDRTGPLNRTTLNTTYAYHLALHQKGNLALGMGVGINLINLNTSMLRFKSEGDAVIGNSGSLQKTFPDLNLGIYYYTASFYLGAAAQQVLPQKLSFAEASKQHEESVHYFIHSGYKFWISEEFSASPSLMLKYIPHLSPSCDANLKIAYRNDFWTGVSLKKDEYALMIGFSLFKKFSLGYAYEYASSDFQPTTSGSQEIILGITF